MNHQAAAQEAQVTTAEFDPMVSLLEKPVESVTTKADNASKLVEGLTVENEELKRSLRTAEISAAYKATVIDDLGHSLAAVKAGYQDVCATLDGHRVISVCAFCGQRDCGQKPRMLIRAN